MKFMNTTLVNVPAERASMPKYTPIQTPMIKSSISDLANFQWEWTNRSVVADFFMPDDEEHFLRVNFGRVEIARILDEMPLSTEPESTKNEGLISDHFAYKVEGTAFWQCQSDALKQTHPRLRHFRFLTGWTCLDILACEDPTFHVVPAA
jgi:hypothetical protein